ncbi:MAG: hypothetical protein JXR36_00125 [Bacteroidales bacterium]|nr:hypothetical protein [Bacteroidales bacterium]
MKSKSLHIVLVFCLICSYSCVNRSEKRFLLEADDKLNSQVVISNQGNYSAKYSLEFNGNHLYNIYDIMQEIKQDFEEKSDEPIELKAWRFVHNLSFTDVNIADVPVQNSPTLILNSLGGGLCGSRSAILTNILIAMGFKARSWCVEGHVVTEVFSNDKWQVLDPDYGVYFLNNSNEIASFFELCENPTWFDDTSRYVLVNYSEAVLLNVFMMDYAKMFATTEDNRRYNTGFDHFPNPDLEFVMPPGAKLVFPVKNSDRGVFYQNAKLSFVDNYCGAIKIPLVLDEIIGKGKVKINNHIYYIDGGLKNFEDFNIGFGEFEIIENLGIELFYFINPELFKIQSCNEIVLRGSNLNHITIDVECNNENEIFLPEYRNQVLEYVHVLLTDYSKNSNSGLFNSRDESLNYLCDSICSYEHNANDLSGIIDTTIIKDQALLNYLLQQMSYFLSTKCDCEDSLN